MRAITKGPEPKALTTYKRQGGKDYDSSPKRDIRAALLIEQHGLCCYCMCRIHLDTMQIEHWSSQSKSPFDKLNFRIMLGVCPGGTKAGSGYRHCDTSRGNKPLVINPADVRDRVEQRVRYLVDGTITSDEPAVENQLNVTFNLNLAEIRNRRKALLTAFQQRLKLKGHMDKAACSSELKKWDGTKAGDLEPYSGIVAYYLRKRISKT